MFAPTSLESQRTVVTLASWTPIPFSLINDGPGTSLMVQWGQPVTLPLQGAWVRSLVGKLGSHMLFSMAKKKKKIFFFLKNGPSSFCKWHHGGEQPEVVLWLSVLCITPCGVLITALLGWVSRWWVWWWVW